MSCSVLLSLVGFLGHRFRVLSGHWRFAKSQLLSKILFPQFQSDLPVRLRNGIIMNVDSSDFNGRQLALFGTVDPKIILTCSGLLQRGDVFLDIGANYGCVGFLCRDFVGEGGIVHLFEPQPDLCRRIKECIDRYGMANCVLHPIGLLDREGSMSLVCRPGHSGVASLVRSKCPAESVLLQVPVKSVSQYLAPILADRAFGVKLDVEGAEPFLLPWLTAQRNLRFIVFEVSNIRDREGAWHVLTTKGLTVYGIARSLFRVRLELIRHPDGLLLYNDVVAVRLGTTGEPPKRGTPKTFARGMNAVL